MARLWISADAWEKNGASCTANGVAFPRDPGYCRQLADELVIMARLLRKQARAEEERLAAES